MGYIVLNGCIHTCNSPNYCDYNITHYCVNSSWNSSRLKNRRCELTLSVWTTCLVASALRFRSEIVISCFYFISQIRRYLQANVNVKKIEIIKCQLLLTVSPVYMTFQEWSWHTLKKYFFLQWHLFQKLHTHNDRTFSYLVSVSCSLGVDSSYM